MRILFFSHYFPPEVNAPATRTFEHCRRWVRAGHDVTVVTCVPNCPDGVVYRGYRNRIRRQVEEIDGVRVVRVWTYVAPNSGTVRRIANYVSYQASATWAALRLEQPDVIIATSPQFFCGWAGVWASRFKRVPLVLEIRDVWPESIAAVGAMRRGLGIRYLEWLERRMYLAAQQIVTVGTGYRDHVLRRAPETTARTCVITNGVDGDLYVPQEPNPAFLERYGLSGKFVCSYVGTIGMAHGLDVVLRSARRLKEAGRDDIVFLLVGDGARRAALEEQAREDGLADRVVFTGRLAKDEMPTVLASSDACLVHLRGTELFGTVIPSKIFETMAMERPIIMGVKGPARQIVMDAGAGMPMEPDSDEELSRIIRQLADNRAGTVAMGRRGRAYVLEHYNRDRLAGEYLELLESLAPNGHSALVPGDTAARHCVAAGSGR
jgi:glycosyltransferase involved in cell wall biosynthesis